MSGGAFNYINMSDFIDVIQEAIIINMAEDDIDSATYGKGYSQEIIDMLTQTVKELELMDKKLHAIDYLLEGDFGEEAFLKEWKEIK